MPQPLTKVILKKATPPGVGVAAYAQGDAYGTEMRFNRFLGRLARGKITQIMVHDYADLGPDLKLYFYPRGLTTDVTNNAPWSVADADLSKQEFWNIHDIAAASWKDANAGSKIYVSGALALPLWGVSADMYGLIEIRSAGGYTPTAVSDLQVTVIGELYQWK